MVYELAIKEDDTQEAPKICQSDFGWTVLGGGKFDDGGDFRRARRNSVSCHLMP